MYFSCHILVLSDNDLVYKQILTHSAKLANLAIWSSVYLQIEWLWVWILLKPLINKSSFLVAEVTENSEQIMVL